jgi:3-hydroxybutyryl-CoA dehydrogenase
MTQRPTIACLGCGRMARGVAVTFAYAGHSVVLIDLKKRGAAETAATATDAIAEIEATLRDLASLGLFSEFSVAPIVARISVAAEPDAAAALPTVAFIFECVPEILDLKREVLRRASAMANPNAIIASTTSTILVNDLASATGNPRRFLNSHYLNPAFLVPLVELAPGSKTDPAVVTELKGLLESIGKVPVVCGARPGYIVPRIQALAMNEAARLVEEGVASAAEIDKAIKFGFGVRFAVLGMLEFIDWGGGDILYHAGRYLTQALGSDRYAPPDIVAQNMHDGCIGLRTGKGFLDYDNLYIDAYRSERLQAFIKLLSHLGMMRPPSL